MYFRWPWILRPYGRLNAKPCLARDSPAILTWERRHKTARSYRNAHKIRLCGEVITSNVLSTEAHTRDSMAARCCRVCTCIRFAGKSFKIRNSFAGGEPDQVNRIHQVFSAASEFHICHLMFATRGSAALWRNKLRPHPRLLDKWLNGIDAYFSATRLFQDCKERWLLLLEGLWRREGKGSLSEREISCD